MSGAWRFPRAFRSANAAELFEMAAFYGMFIAVTLYPTDAVGFSDIEAAWIAGVFAAGLYLLPPFAGAPADAPGFSHPHSFFCPDPALLTGAEASHACENANRIRLIFAAIGCLAAGRLIVCARRRGHPAAGEEHP
ncbi:MAG: hypothetical protein WB626_09525 [Bacteroidota bacterium]